MDTIPYFHAEVHTRPNSVSTSHIVGPSANGYLVEKEWNLGPKDLSSSSRSAIYLVILSLTLHWLFLILTHDKYQQNEYLYKNFLKINFWMWNYWGKGKNSEAFDKHHQMLPRKTQHLQFYQQHTSPNLTTTSTAMHSILPFSFFQVPSYALYSQIIDFAIFFSR